MCFPRFLPLFLILVTLGAACAKGDGGRKVFEEEAKSPLVNADEAAQEPEVAAKETSAIETVAARVKETRDWPQWRGARRDGVSAEKGLLDEWPEGGPKLLWTFEDAGVGYSAPVIRGNKLYCMGGKDGKTWIYAVNIKTGKWIWSTPLDTVFENNWGDGPRGSVTIDGKNLYGITGNGLLFCVDANSGEGKWSKHLVTDFGGAVPNWGYTESPLALGNNVLATPGGKNCIVSLDKKTGETNWMSTGIEDGAQYSSLVPLTVENVDMVTTMTTGGLVGVDAKSGQFLWRYDKTANSTAVIPTPVVQVPYVYSTSGYGTGSGLVKLTVSGSAVAADEVYFSRAMKNQHGGVLRHNDNIFGYSDGGGWLCQDFMTGKVLWHERQLGKGAITCADGKIYCYTEAEGMAVLADASPDGWKERGRFTIPKTSAIPRKSGQIWTHPVIADGKLFLRDHELLFCFDIEQP